MAGLISFIDENQIWKQTFMLRFFFTALVQPVLTCERDCIHIGVISNGIDNVSTETISHFGLNISLERHWIDTSEIYDIFRSIKKLDADEDIDVVTLFDFDTSFLRMPELLRTRNKKLIKWGERHTITEQANKQPKGHQIDPDDICGTEELPNLSEDDPYCIKELNATFKQRDNRLLTLLAPKALTTIVKQAGWKSVFIFYETSTETEVSDLVNYLSEAEVLLALFNIDDEKSLYSLLQRMYKIKIQNDEGLNIIVLCQMSCVKKILRTANKFDTSQEHKTLLKMLSKWLVVVYGHSKGASRSLQACADDLDNVAVIAFPEISGNGTEAFIGALKSILLDIVKEELSGSHIDIKQAIIDRLETTAATWSPASKCLAYNIDTLLHTRSGRRFSSVGYIEIDGNVKITSNIFPNKQYGYNKRHFVVSTLHYPPFVTKREINGSVKYEGFCMDLLQEMAYKLNFTFTITEPEDGKWGAFDDTNFTFNGLTGQLQREEVDMVAAPLSITSDRVRVMDFSYPFYYEYTSVIVKKPDINATKWRTLVDPFKWEVLVAIGLALPIMTTLAFIMERYNPFYNTLEHSEERERNGGLHRWHSSVWYMYGALLCQGGVHLPDSFAGRTIVSSWWLFCIIIVGIYSGNLIAFLTVTKEKPPFDTLAEMIKLKGSYKWGTLSDTYFATVFLRSENPTYKAVGNGIRDFNKTDTEILNSDPEVHIRKVKNEKYAWIGDKTYIEISMAKECSLTSIKEEFLPLKYGLGFTKNSPHTHAFTKKIIKLHEGGLFQIWKRKWWPKANFCAGNTIPEAKPISLMDVQSAFYVCVIGILFGSVAFVIEIIVHRCRKRKSVENKRTLAVRKGSL